MRRACFILIGACSLVVCAVCNEALAQAAALPRPIRLPPIIAAPQSILASTAVGSASARPAPIYMARQQPVVAAAVPLPSLAANQAPPAGPTLGTGVSAPTAAPPPAAPAAEPKKEGDDKKKEEDKKKDKPSIDWSVELQADSVMVDQTDANRLVLGDLRNFSDFRRARLAAIGKLYENVSYRLEFDIAQQGRPTFLDVFGTIDQLPILQHVRIGHFFEPFSLQRLTSNRHQTFTERPLVDAFAPARNLGVSSFGTYRDDRITWALGMFATDTNDVGEQQFDPSGNSVTGRITALPFWDDRCDGWRYMHVGACFSSRWFGGRTTRYGYWPGARPGAFDNIVWPRWVDTGAIAARQAQLFDLEWAWVRGRWHAQAEWASSAVDQLVGARLNFHAWYLETGWFLTGEHRPYKKDSAIFDRVKPFRNFLRKRGETPGCGAWQVAFRIDQLDVNDRNVQGGRLLDLTSGFNWYLNPYTRLYFDYVHPYLRRGVPLASEGNLFVLRAQFEY